MTKIIYMRAKKRNGCIITDIETMGRHFGKFKKAKKVTSAFAGDRKVKF